jgi:aconitate hydratase
MASLDSFKCRREMTVAGKTYTYFDLKEAEKNGLDGASKLPYTLKVLLENLLRFEDGRTVTKADIEAVAAWTKTGKSSHEIAYRPARVLMQDFTGVPAVVDLAAMRDATTSLGGDPKSVNPLVPVDLVIDHSVMVDYFGHDDSFEKNVSREYERNGERYEFLKWGSSAFDNFRVVPPGTGICHQVNLENLAQTVWTKDEDGVTYAYPDTLVGTDSHTTMVNGLAVLGWGVGGIEAEAAMLGQPISMLIPEVVGFKLTGKLPEGATATDLVLTVVEMLRKKAWSASSWNSSAPASTPCRWKTCDHRQHGARIRRDLRLLPGRQRNAGLSARHRPRRRPRAAGRAILQGPGHVPPRAQGRAGLHRHAGAGPVQRRAVAGRPQASAGPRGARRRS